jgi:uncharacterized membrane protein
MLSAYSPQRKPIVISAMPALRNRILSIDTLRGLVMVIMALDHVRDFFHVTGLTQDTTNLSTTTPALFFTRWITHFCAPVFVFLAGTSAYLLGQKRTKKELSAFLIMRGLWLVIAEIALISLGLTFDPLFGVILLDVIWAIGWSMILLGLLINLPFKIVVAIGLIIFFGHNVFDIFPGPQKGVGSVLMKVFFTAFGSFYPLSSNHVVGFLYAILPWTSVMILGYGFGYFYRTQVSSEQRRKSLLLLGNGVIALFIIFRFINAYGDTRNWAPQKTGLLTFLSFINTTKYPPSLQYLCMTLGPAIIVLALIEKIQNKFTSFLTTYGRVPFFYYILHIYLIHLLCVAAFFITGHSANQITDKDSPFLFRPAKFGFSLSVVYLVWIFVVMILYPLCRWYNNYKATHNKWWLSYL